MVGVWRSVWTSRMQPLKLILSNTKIKINAEIFVFWTIWHLHNLIWNLGVSFWVSYIFLVLKPTLLKRGVHESSKTCINLEICLRISKNRIIWGVSEIKFNICKKKYSNRSYQEMQNLFVNLLLYNTIFWPNS